MTRRVVTFSQNLKLEYPDLWFSGEKIGFEKRMYAILARSTPLASLILLWSTVINHISDLYKKRLKYLCYELRISRSMALLKASIIAKW